MKTLTSPDRQAADEGSARRLKAPLATRAPIAVASKAEGARPTRLNLDETEVATLPSGTCSAHRHSRSAGEPGLSQALLALDHRNSAVLVATALFCKLRPVSQYPATHSHSLFRADDVDIVSYPRPEGGQSRRGTAQEGPADERRERGDREKSPRTSPASAHDRSSRLAPACGTRGTKPFRAVNYPHCAVMRTDPVRLDVFASTGRYRPAVSAGEPDRSCARPAGNRSGGGTSTPCRSAS